ncbi:Anaerobic nitric oxide reductase transcription regulator NorR [Neomoorella glycerini]|uniref:Anaerobic nitric oxide reductase transcription regulator NorR n=1 Tax=Neomoorella glycerini TaxID=55779 RepID=A0A6I5ZTB7_9FIRM|nr:sigma 54-interacting transcriptional regulator [Moorella glycerini]QGP93160.1 Anaerobic nitric oxide reductase transcription regulator NorR [Moorella glycerini]
MKPRIGLLSLSSSLSVAMRTVAQELSEEIKIMEIEEPDPLDEEAMLQAARRLAARCDVLIGRAATINHVAPHISIPTVECPLTLTDILEALHQAGSKGKQLALILYRNCDCDLGRWPEVFGIRVGKYLVASRQEANGAIQRAREAGATVIVSTSLICRYAELAGMNYQVIETTRETILHTLRKAVDIVKAVQKEREHAIRLQTLLGSAHEGIILLDENNRVSYLNNTACRLLNLSRGNVAGGDIISILNKLLVPGTSNLEVIFKKETDPQLGKLLKLKPNKSIAANIVPIKVAGEVTGKVITLVEAAQLQQMEFSLRRQLAEKGLVAKFTLEDIIGKSQSLEYVREQVRAFAVTDATVLIRGETGTGKELFAHSIHQLSRRRAGPFVALNCSALPKELMESEFFGYEEGAFTGARKSGKIGMFELAHKGTIFLDEIGTMPLDLQAKLLRVIQEREIIRLGSSRVIPIDVRIIAATNCDLETAVQKGDFRQDLFFRLNVLPLTVPPLRQRPEDIPLLFAYFVKKLSDQLGCHVEMPGSDEVSLLQTYNWPGNVRELENFVERYVALASYRQNNAGLLEQLLAEIKQNRAGDAGSLAGDAGVTPAGEGLAPFEEVARMLARAEHDMLCSLGKQVNWNRKKMAAMLGISSTTLWRRLKQAGITLKR